jgi:hypothetical protein
MPVDLRQRWLKKLWELAEGNSGAARARQFCDCYRLSDGARHMFGSGATRASGRARLGCGDSGSVWGAADSHSCRPLRKDRGQFIVTEIEPGMLKMFRRAGVIADRLYATERIAFLR